KFANDVTEAYKKNDTINGFLTNPAAPEVDVDVRKVTLEQLRTAPYRASVDFYRAEYAPADRSILNLKKTIYTVTFVFMFKDQILQDLVEKICNFPCTVKLIATTPQHQGLELGPELVQDFLEPAIFYPVGPRYFGNAAPHPFSLYLDAKVACYIPEEGLQLIG